MASPDQFRAGHPIPSSKMASSFPSQKRDPHSPIKNWILIPSSKMASPDLFRAGHPSINIDPSVWCFHPLFKYRIQSLALNHMGCIYMIHLAFYIWLSLSLSHPYISLYTSYLTNNFMFLILYYSLKISLNDPFYLTESKSKNHFNSKQFLAPIISYGYHVPKQLFYN